MVDPDLDGLIAAMTSSLDSIRYYYDRNTGETVMLSDEFSAVQLEGPAGRYEPVTPLSVSERFQIMEDFVETLNNDALEDELNQVLTEKGAFLKFDEALTHYPTRNRQWIRFRSDRVASYARAWLKEHGLL
jgi:hypothetical protein